MTTARDCTEKQTTMSRTFVNHVLTKLASIGRMTAVEVKNPVNALPRARAFCL